MSKTRTVRSVPRRRASVTLTLAPATRAYLDAYAAARGLTRSAGLDALVAAHESAVRPRLPRGIEAEIGLLAGLMRQAGANPGLDPALRLGTLVAVGRVLRPEAVTALDAAGRLLDRLSPADRVALLEAVEERAAAAA